MPDCESFQLFVRQFSNYPFLIILPSCEIWQLSKNSCVSRGKKLQEVELRKTQQERPWLFAGFWRSGLIPAELLFGHRSVVGFLSAQPQAGQRPGRMSHVRSGRQHQQLGKPRLLAKLSATDPTTSPQAADPVNLHTGTNNTDSLH